MSLQTGWLRALLAAIAGLALFAGHPPLSWGPIAVVALAPLLLLARGVQEDGHPGRTGLGYGLLAGAAFFGPLLYWIARFGVVPWLLLVLIQASFVAVWMAALCWWGQRRGRAAFAAFAWAGLEWLRSAWPFGGFPWGVLGYTQHDGGMLLPVARTLSVFGVSLLLAGLAVSLETAVVAAVRAWRRRAPGDNYGELVFGAARNAIGTFLVLLIAAVLLGGDPPAGDGRTVHAAAIQGNDQDLPPLVSIEELGRVERIVDLMVETTAELAAMPGPIPDFVVWPENSLDADIRGHPGLEQRVREAIALIGEAPLIAGTLLDGPVPGTFVNAMVRYGREAEIRDIAVKRKLVPFGEYVPLRRWFQWYPALRHIPKDGIPGDEAVVFDLEGARVAPITCYESLFGELVRDQVRGEGAEVLVVSTNNASYGRSPASRQHLAFSQLRAVETCRWVLHAGISGVSAVVDPRGRTSQETALFERAVLRAELPLVDAMTPAMVLGDAAGWLSLLLALAMSVIRATADRMGRSKQGPVV